MPSPPFEIITLTGANPGPVLVILGGVHGNEHCGPDAITRMIEDLTIDAGTLICVPRVNQRALDANVRFVDANLNRIMGNPDAGSHEGRLVEPLRAVLDRANYLLDLHSYQAGGPAFVFGAEDAESMAFAHVMPGAIIVTGWSACYERTHPELHAAGMGTTEYARTKGAVALTYECGQHLDPVAVENGCAGIRAALVHTGLSAALPLPNPAPLHVRMTHIFLKDKPGRHARAWKHTEKIAKGEVFAVFDDGTEQLAPEDGVIILPHPGALIGVEWGYLGTGV